MYSWYWPKPWTGSYREFYKRPKIREPRYDDYAFISRLAPQSQWVRLARQLGAAHHDPPFVAAELPEQAIITILEHGLIEDLFAPDPLEFNAPLPKTPYFPPRPTNPLDAKPTLLDVPPEPTVREFAKASHSIGRMQIGPLNSLINRFRRAKALREYGYEHVLWEREVRSIQEQNRRTLQDFEKAVLTSPEYQEYCNADEYWERQHALLQKEDDACMRRWCAHRDAFDEEKRKEADYLWSLKTAVDYGQADAIEYVVSITLQSALLPWGFQSTQTAHYDPESKVLLIDYQLPDFERVTFVSETAKGPKPVSQRKTLELRERGTYAIVLAVLVGVAQLIKDSPTSGIALNGHVTFIDKAIGNERTEVVLSLFAPINELLQLHLPQIDPKIAFRALKGIAAGTFTGYVPVPPVMQYNTADHRIVEGKDVIGGLVENENIAAMPWEDFEHLIRELFEKEFGVNGIEVKVTRANRDSGVDAIAFDPDPIRGGKFVIQAKRYTRTVDVSSVRDLYGTVQNEGANRGILVTTSKFGPDSREFVRGKPLTLLDGANLLALLNKHGYRLSIDLEAARKMLNEKGCI